MSLPGRQIYIFLTLIFFFSPFPGHEMFIFWPVEKIVPHEICDIWCCEMPDERYVIDVLVRLLMQFECIERHIFSGISDYFRLFLTYALTPL